MARPGELLLEAKNSQSLCQSLCSDFAEDFHPDCSSAFRAYRVAKLRITAGEDAFAGYGFLEEILWWILKKMGRIFESPLLILREKWGFQDFLAEAGARAGHPPFVFPQSFQKR